MIGIYKYTNKINGKIYVGQSVNINKWITDSQSNIWKRFNLDASALSRVISGKKSHAKGFSLTEENALKARINKKTNL